MLPTNVRARDHFIMIAKRFVEQNRKPRPKVDHLSRATPRTTRSARRMQYRLRRRHSLPQLKAPTHLSPTAARSRVPFDWKTQSSCWQNPAIVVALLQSED